MLDLKSICQEIESKSDFTKMITIRDMEFELGLLSAEQEKLVNNLIQELRDEESGAIELLDDMRRRTCSYAIRKIKGEPVPDVVEVEEVLESGVHKKVDHHLYLMESMRTWPNSMISALFEAYTDLKKQADADIKASIKYDWFEDPALLKDEEAGEADADADPEESLNFRKVE